MNIWVWVQVRDGAINTEALGLVAEAKRILFEKDETGVVTALAFGQGLKKDLEALGAHGVDRVIYLEADGLEQYHGELFANNLFKIATTDKPTLIFMAQNAETSDLAPRLAALMETALITRAMDFQIADDKKAVVIRPVSNGYLFESLSIECDHAPIICFLPSVLTSLETIECKTVQMIKASLDGLHKPLKTTITDTIEASATDLDLEEADIIVAGGRGVGKDGNFDILHELAGLLGGPVGGTRPVVDWDTLPYERQIGQTGKVVAPRLLINCGISGANEYTAGIENSKLIIAINKDERARIFKFADLGIVGDVHDILPLVIQQINKPQGF